VAIYGSVTWTLNKDIAKRIANFDIRVLRRMFGRIKVNENGRKRYNKELKQLFLDLDIPPFVRKSRFNWIIHVNRMDSKRKVSKVFNNNPRGSRLRGRPRNRWWNCVQTDIKKRKITDGKERLRNIPTGRSLLRGRKFALG
jgi:hypothetical protein